MYWNCDNTGEHGLTGHSAASAFNTVIVSILFSQIAQSTIVSVYTKTFLQTQVSLLKFCKKYHILGHVAIGVTLISVPTLQLGNNSFQGGDREAIPPDLVDLLPFFPPTL